MLGRRSRDVQRERTYEQDQPRHMKKAPNQDVPCAPKANNYRGDYSNIGRPTCSNSWKNNFGNCLANTSGCFIYGKNDHNVINCPDIAAGRRQAKQSLYNGPDVGEQKKNCLYALQENKETNQDEGTNK